MTNHRNSWRRRTGGVWLLPLAAALAALAALVAPVPGAADDASSERGGARYVAPEPGAPFEHPPLRALRLAEEKPDDLRERVDYRGRVQRYGEIRYGTPGSARVALVVDERDGGAFDLYVDRNRDRAIEPRDLVPGKGRLRRTELAAEIARGDTAEHLPRVVVFRRGITASTLSYATAGYLETEVEFAGAMVAVRRIDADGNGLFADAGDRVWFDLDGDGEWDPFTEQFPFLPVLRLEGKRYALRSDDVGSRLAVEEITGVGSVRLTLAGLDPSARVAALDVMLLGEDGSAYAVRAADEAVSVPVGRYAFGTVTLALEDARGLPWRSVFSRMSRPADDQWHEVRPDQDLTLDPVGSLRFVLECRETTVDAGKTLGMSPRLYTADGLLINSCDVGADAARRPGSGQAATIRLQTADASVLDTASSGFA